MAYLDASDFTLDLIQDSRKFPPPERLKVLVQSEDALLNALGYLRNYSMIQFGQIEHYYIHGVIHRWAFEILTEGNDIEMLHRAFHCVGSKAKERHREGYWATALSLAPHTSRLVFFIKRGLLDLYQKTDIFWQDSVIGLVKLLTAQNFELEMAKRALFFIITGTHVSSPQAMDFENVQSLKDNFKNPVSFSKQAMISLGNIWHQEKNYNQAADLFLRMMLIVQDINSGTYVKDFTRVCKNYCTNVSLGGLRSSLVPSALSPESKAIYDFLKAMEEGDKLSISGDYQNAIRVFEGLRDDSATYPTELNDVRIGVNLGIAYTGSGELQLAKDTLIRILPHSQANRGNCSETLLILKELGNVYNQEGQTYIGSGNIDKSTEAFKTAKDYFRKAMDGYGNCKGLKNRSFLEVVADLCLVQVNMGDFDEAMILFQEYADEIKQMLPVIDFMVRAKISNRARGARNRVSFPPFTVSNSSIPITVHL
jgi:tetratricopeptide (TPR) repeat protein